MEWSYKGASEAKTERVKTEVDHSGKWDKKVVTEIVKAGPFYPAEGTCHYLRD